MKAFRFSLEPVLTLKREILEEWEMKLARAVGECVNLENRINKNLSEIKRVNSAEREDINTLVIRSRFVTRMTQENGKTRQLLEMKIKERNKVQEGYNEAYKQCQALEKLKEKKYEEFRKLRNKEEFKFIDDINNGAAIRSVQN